MKLINQTMRQLLVELHPDLLVAIAARLSYPELVRFAGSCTRIRGIIDDHMMKEEKRRGFTLAQTVANALADQISAHFDVYDLFRFQENNKIVWRQNGEGPIWIEMTYLLHARVVYCEFPATVKKSGRVYEQRMWATVDSNASGHITRLHNSANYDALEEMEAEMEFGRPMEPIPYTDGLFAFMVAQGLFTHI